MFCVDQPLSPQAVAKRQRDAALPLLLNSGPVKNNVVLTDKQARQLQKALSEMTPDYVDYSITWEAVNNFHADPSAANYNMMVLMLREAIIGVTYREKRNVKGSQQRCDVKPTQQQGQYRCFNYDEVQQSIRKLEAELRIIKRGIRQ
jgi:hypothetical protein